MVNTPRRGRRVSNQAPDIETNTGPDVLRDDLRRRDQRDTPPDSMPPRAEEAPGEEPAGGGFTPAPDGGNPDHPIHDEDQEDATPSDYEREINRLDKASFERIADK
jgi:hypothetical protein